MQSITKAALRASRPGRAARLASAYRHRFNAQQVGQGMSRQALGAGIWGGSCDAASLAKLWPAERLSAGDAARRLEVFRSLRGKGLDAEAAVGEARMLIALGRYAEARAALPARGAGGAVEAAVEAARAVSLQNELVAVMAAQEIDAKAAPQPGPLVAELNDSFNALQKLRPDDWEVSLAQGESLLKRGDAQAISVLEKAVAGATREANSRRGLTEVYVKDKSSTAALADYVDYKYQAEFRNGELGSVLGPLAERTEPAMEKELAARFPSLTGEQLAVLLPLLAALEAGSLGMVESVRPTAEVRVKPWGSSKAKEATHLLEQYTAGRIGSLKAHNDLTVDEELAVIEAMSETSPSVENVLQVQKRLSIALAEDIRDRAKTLLGEAYLVQGEDHKALGVLTEVVKENSYRRMYDTLLIRGKVLFKLGFVDKAHNDFTKAHEQESAFVDRDIPTFDANAFRNEF